MDETFSVLDSNSADSFKAEKRYKIITKLDQKEFVVPQKIIEKMGTLHNLIRDISVEDGLPIPIFDVSATDFRTVIHLLELDLLSISNLQEALGDLNKSDENYLRAVRILNISNYLAAEYLLEQMAIYIGIHFPQSEVEELTNLPLELVLMIKEKREERFRVKKIAAGGKHSCAIRMDSSVVCWGDNHYDQITVSGDLRAKDIKLGHAHSCVRDHNNHIQCWGWNRFQQCNIDDAIGDVEIKAIATGTRQYYAIKIDNSVHSCGNNEYGQLNIPAKLGPIHAIDAGFRHTCAIKMENNRLQCWGRNTYGQKNIPIDLVEVKKVALGNEHTCVIDYNNRLRCWGRNNKGQINIPLGLGEVREVALGSMHTCAIKWDSSLSCFGSDRYNQVSVPEDLGRVKAVSLGAFHSCVINENDAVRCWGNNSKGQATIPGSLHP